MNYGFQIELLTADRDKFKQQRDDLLVALKAIADPQKTKSHGDPSVLRGYAKAAIAKVEES